jgi:hypothetical protein
LSAMSLEIPTDHLHCTGVATPESTCPDGESGVGMVTIQDVPDICVPGCEVVPGTEHRRPCHPTFTCVAAIEFSSRAPATCVPGLPGYRCSGEHSCLVGDCVETGLGFSVCTIPCASDSTCEAIDTFRGPYWCVGTPGGSHHCLNAESFRHECRDHTDCPDGELCSNKDAFHAGGFRFEEQGPECRKSCDFPDGRCEARGEVAFSCLPVGECHPGVFGIPCRDEEECVRGLSCEPFDDEELVARVGSRSVCTIRCTTDSDCRGHPFVASDVATCLNPALRDSDTEASRPPGICIFPS